MTAQWRTKEELAAAWTAFASTIPGWQNPQAHGVGVARPGGTDFPVVNVGDHNLPAVVMAVVCGHPGGTGAYPVPFADLERAIAMLAPAEACPDYDHPNVQAWRRIRDELQAAGGGEAVAVFVGDLGDPVADEHDARFRARLPGNGSGNAAAGVSGAARTREG